MKKITKITSAAAVALMMVLTNGCKKEEMTPPSSSSSPLSAQKVTPSPDDHDATRPAALNLRLFGTNPGHFAALDFTIMSVSLHVVSKSGLVPVNKWINVPQTPRLVNILKFHAMNPELLANLNLPDGNVTEIRIDFAKRGIVAWTENGVEQRLKAPFSPAHVIVPTHIVLRHGTLANVMLALDVDNSVNMEGGANRIFLTPVIKVHNRVFDKSDDAVSGEAGDPITE